jgi:flavin-binding protein dodecin
VGDEHEGEAAAAGGGVAAAGDGGIPDLGRERATGACRVDDRAGHHADRKACGVGVEGARGGRGQEREQEGDEGHRSRRQLASDAPPNAIVEHSLAGGKPIVEKTITLSGTPTNSIEDAVGLAVTRASATIDGIRQVEIAGITAMVEDGTVNAWKVRLRVTFAVQERLHE